MEASVVYVFSVRSFMFGAAMSKHWRVGGGGVQIHRKYHVSHLLTEHENRDMPVCRRDAHDTRAYHLICKAGESCLIHTQILHLFLNRVIFSVFSRSTTEWASFCENLFFSRHIILKHGRPRGLI